MLRLFLHFLLAVLIFLSVAVFSLYQWGGLGAYVKDLSKIYSLPVPLRDQALANLRGGDGDIQGILGWVNTMGGGGVLVWRGFLPQYFSLNSGVLYSYWHACDNPSLFGLAPDKQGNVGRDVVMNIDTWSKRVHPGEYVTLQSSTSGIIHEVYAYDWRVYLPVGLEEQCAN